MAARKGGVATNLDDEDDFEDDIDTDEDDGDEDGEEDGDSEEDPEPEAPPVRAADRKRKRGNRFAEAEARAREYEEENKKLREAQLQREQQWSQQVLQMQQAFIRPQQEQQQHDPYKERLEHLYSKRMELTRQFDSLPAAEQKSRLAEFQQKVHEVEVEQQSVVTERTMARMPQFQQLQQPQVNPQQSAMKAALVLEFQDLIPAQLGGTAQTTQFMHEWEGEFQKAMARGKPRDLATMRECAAKVRKEFQLGGAQPAQRRTAPPQPAERQRFVGMSSSGAGPDQKTAGRPLSKDEKRMARRAFAHLSEAAAYKRFLKERDAKDD